jgi:hypothetical protein
LVVGALWRVVSLALREFSEAKVKVWLPRTQRGNAHFIFAIIFGIFRSPMGKLLRPQRQGCEYIWINSGARLDLQGESRPGHIHGLSWPCESYVAWKKLGTLNFGVLPPSHGGSQLPEN